MEYSKEKDAYLQGDCDDFSLTVLWILCNRSIFRFIWNVIILHKYRIYHARTYLGKGHAVGYAHGLYFDNWTLDALPKEEFLNKTKHSLKFFYPSVFILIYMLFGLFK